MRRDCLIFTDDEKDKIVELYLSGLTIIQVAEKINKPRHAVGNFIKNKSLSRSCHDPIYRQCPIREDYLEVIDAEEKAYFLGFFFADGFIHNSGNTCGFTNHIKDDYIFKKFSSLIYINDGDGFSYTKRGQAAFHIYSKKMCKDLEKFGLHKRKTFDLEFPPKNLIPDNMMNHFIRGVFDGDGCICNYKNKSNNKLLSHFSIIGTESLMGGINDILSAVTERPKKLYTTKYKNLVNIKHNAIDSIRLIYEYLYNNATMFLTRKLDKFESFLKTVNPHFQSVLK